MHFEKVQILGWTPYCVLPFRRVDNFSVSSSLDFFWLGESLFFKRKKVRCDGVESLQLLVSTVVMVGLDYGSPRFWYWIFGVFRRISCIIVEFDERMNNCLRYCSIGVIGVNCSQNIFQGVYNDDVGFLIV